MRIHEQVGSETTPHKAKRGFVQVKAIVDPCSKLRTKLGWSQSHFHFVRPYAAHNDVSEAIASCENTLSRCQQLPVGLDRCRHDIGVIGFRVRVRYLFELIAEPAESSDWDCATVRMQRLDGYAVCMAHRSFSGYELSRRRKERHGPGKCPIKVA